MQDILDMLSMSLESFQSSYSFGVAISISFVGSFGALRAFWGQLKSFGVVRPFFMSSGVFRTVLEFDADQIDKCALRGSHDQFKIR